jgi:hypothetical protein
MNVKISLEVTDVENKTKEQRFLAINSYGYICLSTDEAHEFATASEAGFYLLNFLALQSNNEFDEVFHIDTVKYHFQEEKSPLAFIKLP